jgi:hypothetical protein
MSCSSCCSSPLDTGRFRSKLLCCRIDQVLLPKTQSLFPMLFSPDKIFFSFSVFKRQLFARLPNGLRLPCSPPQISLWDVHYIVYSCKFLPHRLSYKRHLSCERPYSVLLDITPSHHGGRYVICIFISLITLLTILGTIGQVSNAATVR